jgi:uncharacterized protein
MNYPVAVTALVNLNGGRMVGKTRLQKTVYLLKECGIDLGFDFDYHHYGPYSEELSIASSDAVALGILKLDWQNAYGNEYAIFSATGPATHNGLGAEAAAMLKILGQYDATVLELAATADFLEKNGYADKAWEETERRKASKISAARVRNAKKLLEELRAL